MDTVLEWGLTTISRYPDTATVLVIVTVAGLAAWVIIRDIANGQDEQAEAAARRIDAYWAAMRLEVARREKDAIAYTGKEQP